VKTEIVVALIAATGVCVQATLSYLVNRRNAIDLRSNIDREIDIVRKLQPGSGEAERLERHIKDAIDKLISGDEKRDSASAIMRLPVRMSLIALALYGLATWRTAGVFQWLKPIVEILYWCLWAAFAVLLLQVIVVSIGFLRELSKPFIKAFRYFKALIRVKFSEKYDRAMGDYQNMRAYEEGLVDLLQANKEDFIAKNGQEWWETIMTRHEEIEEMSRAIEGRSRNRRYRPDSSVN
jgi:hypothetical protein